jgi:hypothetical protein
VGTRKNTFFVIFGFLFSKTSSHPIMLATQSLMGIKGFTIKDYAEFNSCIISLLHLSASGRDISQNFDVVIEPVT